MDLKLDDAGDLAFEKGDLVLADGREEIAQHVVLRLKTFLGEWFLDQRVGIPYFDKILVKNPSMAVVRSLLYRAIAETPGVTEVIDLTFELDAANRSLSVSFSANTTDGQVVFEDEEIL